MSMSEASPEKLENWREEKVSYWKRREFGGGDWVL